MKDIATFDDVRLLVDHFYQKVLKDDQISFVFSEYMSTSLEKHLPTMYDFWDSILLGAQTYKGNVMLSHISLNKKVKLKTIHFERWLALWSTTIDELFFGEKADEAKHRAQLMKNLMEFKIAQSENKNFIQ